MSSIASDNNFVCPCDVSFTVLTGTRFNAATFSGDVDAGVNTITGTLRGSGFANAATSLSR